MKHTSELMKTLGKKLDELKMTLVTAESCTGGFIAYSISSSKEASSSLERGYITYSNQSKEDLLGVKPGTLQLHGAVSKEVALEMANGALKNSKAQISIATTGIAGTDEKTEKKGIVWIAFASIIAEPFLLKKEIAGSRKEFIESVTLLAFSELLTYVNKLKHV